MALSKLLKFSQLGADTLGTYCWCLSLLSFPTYRYRNTPPSVPRPISVLLLLCVRVNFAFCVFVAWFKQLYNTHVYNKNKMLVTLGMICVPFGDDNQSTTMNEINFMN